METKIKTIITLILILTVNLCTAAIPIFTPPENWKVAPPKAAGTVKIGFVAPIRNYPPSINLSFEPTNLPLQTYLKLIKSRTSTHANKHFRDLGAIQTLYGQAHLIQIESKTEHGVFRVLQCFIPATGGYHLLTSALHEKQFTAFFPTVKAAFESFDLIPDLFKESDPINHKIKDLITSKLSTKKKLISLEKTLQKDFKDKGIYWQLLVLKAFHEQLLP